MSSFSSSSSPSTHLTQIFFSGKTRPLSYRKEQLQKLAVVVKKYERDIENALAKDMGKPILESIQAEVFYILAEIKLHLSKLDEWAADEVVTTPKEMLPAESKIIKNPRGPALILGAWNYPVQLTLLPLVGAISAGCPAMVKPSEVSPHSAAMVEKIIKEGLDNDAYLVVQGGAHETVELLNQKWDTIFYTGSTSVGGIVAAAGAKHFSNVILEMGGKSPVFVNEDADVKISAKRIMAVKCQNAGQICVAPDYVLVHDKIHDEFVKECISVIEKFYGPDPSTSASFARIVNERHWDRIKHLLDGHGGKIIMGGIEKGNRKEKFIPPTIVLDPKLTSSLMQEEIFGPILPIIRVRDLKQALDIINSKPHSLASYVFAQDKQIADNFFHFTRSGGTTWNDCASHLANSNLPFGGIGPSGAGCYHGKASFDAFTHRRSVLSKPFSPDMKLYPPYNDKAVEFLRSLL
jgi:aldehyde dehydrogenase (NAD+)